jgi:hypothetical protein
VAGPRRIYTGFLHCRQQNESTRRRHRSNTAE